MNRVLVTGISATRAGMGSLLRSRRCLLANALLVAFIVALAIGGWLVPAVVILAMLIGSGIDETVGNECERLGGGARFCDANLYATLPLLAIITFMLFRLVAQADSITLLGPALASDAKGSWPVLGAAFGTGYFYAIPGAAVAHELTHRNTSNLALICARILYALTLNPTFETTHAHGHHRNVGTYRDYATARRGEYVLAFVVRTVTYQSIEGWQAEVKQLRRKGFNIWSWRNRVIGGIICSLVILAAAAITAGFAGVLVFLAAAILGRVLHEMVAYVQHYGLVRVANTRIESRHSWDCGRVISNVLLYNLPRHADHHQFSSKPFWKLDAAAESPKLPHGYETMAIISLIPPWWNKLIGPLLADWDQRLANDGERSLVREHGWTIDAPVQTALKIGQGR